MQCHCDSMLNFDLCCGSILQGSRTAPTALSLMRSRYSAHVEQNVSYILETYGQKQKKLLSRQQIQQGLQQTQWQELEILRVVQGKENDEYGEVEFLAHYLHQGNALTLHEHSYFQKEDGLWKYIGRIEEK